MIGRLTIGKPDEGLEVQTGIYQYDDEYDYEVTIDTNLDSNYLDLISKEYDLDISIDFAKEVCQDEKFLNFLNIFEKDHFSHLKNIEYICINHDMKSVYKYIKENPILQTKKIIIEDENVNSDLLYLFEEFKNNIYFSIPRNDNLVDFDTYIKTSQTINHIIEDINSFNFSNFEKIMYTYDLVREKIYSEVDENQNKFISRDLSTSLLGENIVCLGYSRIFSEILNKLNIICKEVILSHKDKPEGHARNEIYIKDEKYGIDGIYYFDATWGSRKKSADNSYLLSYRYFALTKPKMDFYDTDNLIDKRFPYYSDDLIDIIDEQIKQNGRLNSDIITSINHMSSVINDHHLIRPFGRVDIENVKKELSNIIKYFNKPISAETLLSTLLNVRKAQISMEPEKYPFGEEELFKTVLNSNWNFTGTADENLILILADNKLKARIKKAQMNRFIKDLTITKQISEIKTNKNKKHN